MNAVVTDPVTVVYHELRSPLALMATLARSTAEECDDQVLRGRCLSIVRAAERMLKTAGYLMDVAESAKTATPPRTFNVAEVVEGIVADYGSLGVPVVAYAEGDLPATIHSSPEHLEALLCSLLGNATDHGDPERPIVVSVRTCRGTCEVSVSNPVGPDRRHRGLGLGRYLSEQLAAQLNGAIAVEQTVALYTTTISIPMAAVALPLAV